MKKKKKQVQKEEEKEANSELWDAPKIRDKAETSKKCTKKLLGIERKPQDCNTVWAKWGKHLKKYGTSAISNIVEE